MPKMRKKEEEEEGAGYDADLYIDSHSYLLSSTPLLEGREINAAFLLSFSLGALPPSSSLLCSLARLRRDEDEGRDADTSWTGRERRTGSPACCDRDRARVPAPWRREPRTGETGANVRRGSARP